MSDDYDAAASLTLYNPDRTDKRLARLWATEKLLHDLAALGAITFFEGPGTNPTVLTGYATTKLWLQVSAGVTTSPGTVRAYAGSGDATLVASWPALDIAGLRRHLSVYSKSEVDAIFAAIVPSGFGSDDVENDSGVTGATVSDALDALDAEIRNIGQTDFAGSLAIGGGLANITEAGATAFDGDGLTAYGISALNDVTTGYHSTAVGTRAMEASLTGHSMVAIGYEAVRDDTDPNYSVVIGNSSYLIASNVAQVVAVGYQNFYSTTTGGAQSASLGIYCGFSNTTGTRNTYVGGYAGYRPNAQDTVAIGCNAHYGASVGVTGTGDVSIGYQSGYSMSNHTGYNVSLGWRAGYDLTTGSYNITIGPGPNTLGTTITSGSQNIFIGVGVRYGITQTGSNQLNIGNLLFGTTLANYDNLATTGKIGVGTAAPSARLHVFGDVSSSAGQFSLEGGGTFGPVFIQDNTGTNGATIFTVTTDDNWATVGANKWIMGHGAASTANVDICLDSTGMFGIGTYAPTALLDVASDTIRLRTAKTPASATATGNAGDIAWDSNYIYVCVATDTWKRTAISTW